MECKKVKIGDKYRIDSHKLMYHVPRVNDWMDGKMFSAWAERTMQDSTHSKIRKMSHVKA